MVFSNVLVDITISRRSFVFSQSRFKVSTCFTNVSSLAVTAFDLVYCSLSLSLSLTLVSSGRKVQWRGEGRGVRNPPLSDLMLV